MFRFGAAAASPEFVPPEDARDWIAEGIVELAPKLGPAAQVPRLLTEASALSGGPPRDLDGLFDMVCAVQEVVGQAQVELTLLELDERAQAPELPDGYHSLGDANGKLLHTLRGSEDYLILFTPAVFRVRELMLAAVARELGRVALDRAGLQPDPEALVDWEADAELAGVLLGMGVWLANGAYIFENACCGGGCGIDLRSVRSGLSVPEVSYALALDSQRKGLRRREVLRHLSPTQKTATKRCWSQLSTSTPPALRA